MSLVEILPISYSAEISRTNPTCFLFVIDQSGSMEDKFGSGEIQPKKSDGVADAINNLLRNVVIRCAKSEGVRDYFHVGVIGYGNKVGSAFSGQISGKDLVPISEISDKPVRIDERTKKVSDGAGGLVDQSIKMPVWFDPIANGGTPMCQAMNYAKGVISNWLAQYPNCYPPTVIHITDGESTDGDPTSIMNEITSLSSSDGNVILYNLHLSSNKNAKSITFADSEIGLPDEYSKLLFNAASSLSPTMRSIANNEYALNISDAARGFVLNADLTMIIMALEIGTRPSNLR
jgi:hypothetical protein